VQFDDFDPKRLRLDPTPQGDTSIDTYFTRISSEKTEMKNDRRKLQVLLPYNHLQKLVALKMQVKTMKEAHERELDAMERDIQTEKRRGSPA